MITVSIRRAKTRLSLLLARVAHGESFVIAKAGKPLARVIPVKSTKTSADRLGFLKGEILVPRDFDRMGRERIASMFRDRERGKPG